MARYEPQHPLVIHFRVVGALMLREIHTRFGEFRAGYLWGIVEPMVHVLSFAFIIAYFSHATPLGSSLEVFVATAVVPFFFFREMMMRVETAARSNRALLYFPIVKVIDTVIARVLLEVATWILIAILTLTLLGILGFESMPSDPLKCIWVMIITGWLGAGLGMVNSSIAVFTGAWERVLHVLMRPLYLFSGVAFLPSAMPDTVRNILWYLPTAHLIDWLREGFFDGYYSTFVDKNFIIWLGATLWIIGLFMERMLRSRMEVE